MNDNGPKEFNDVAPTSLAQILGHECLLNPDRYSQKKAEDLAAVSERLTF